MPKGSAKARTSSGTTKEDLSSQFNRTTGAIVPDDWADKYSGAWGNIGDGGFTGDQRAGVDALSGLVSGNPALRGISDAQDELGRYGDTTSDVLGGSARTIRGMAGGYEDRGPNTLAGTFAGQDPRITAGRVGATTVGATNVGDVGDVTARRGTEFMGDYQNPYEQMVVDATKDDYDAFLNRRLNVGKMGAAAGGALGGGRLGVSEGVATGEAARGLTRELGGLRARGFDTAANLGMGDASRYLDADQGNQATQFGIVGKQADVDSARNIKQGGLDSAASIRQAELESAASEAQANLTDVRQRFDVGQADIGAARRMDATGRMIDAETTASGMEVAGPAAKAEAATRAADLGIAGSNLTSENARDLIAAGSISTEQMEILLGLGTVTIGEEVDQTLESKRKTKEKEFGTEVSAGFGV